MRDEQACHSPLVRQARRGSGAACRLAFGVRGGAWWGEHGMHIYAAVVLDGLQAGGRGTAPPPQHTQQMHQARLVAAWARNTQPPPLRHSPRQLHHPNTNQHHDTPPGPPSAPCLPACLPLPEHPARPPWMGGTQRWPPASHPAPPAPRRRPATPAAPAPPPPASWLPQR